MTHRIAAAFVPLVDCAVLVAARECGFARAAGVDLELVKEPSWASLRDHLTLGHVDCAHALAPMPIASALGVGHVQADCFVPFVLGRGGNAITVSTRLFDELHASNSAAHASTPAQVGAALARVVRLRSSPLTLGMVFPFSNHNFELRYWLAAAGVHPDRDLRLVAIPPPLMVESLQAGHVDAFCVGEPWNSLAVERGIGRIVLTTSQMFPRAAEKVLAVRAPLEEQRACLEALLQALNAAAAWADDAANTRELAQLLAKPEYVNVSASLIEESLSGRLLGGGPQTGDRDFLCFHRHDANRPSAEDALWIYAQMVRWGQLKPSAERQQRAAAVFRGDLYSRHVQAPVSSQPRAAVPFDGVVFTAAHVDAYLAQFNIATSFVDTSASQPQ